MQNKYIFNIGDEVITDDGRVGKITSICDCERCKERGFYEPTVIFEDGHDNYITHWDYTDNFGGYYKIGNYVFGNLDLDTVQNFIDRHEHMLQKLYKNKSVILRLMEDQ